MARIQIAAAYDRDDIFEGQVRWIMEEDPENYRDFLNVEDEDAVRDYVGEDWDLFQIEWDHAVEELSCAMGQKNPADMWALVNCRWREDEAIYRPSAIDILRIVLPDNDDEFVCWETNEGFEFVSGYGSHLADLVIHEEIQCPHCGDWYADLREQAQIYSQGMCWYCEEQGVMMVGRHHAPIKVYTIDLGLEETPYGF